MKLKSIQFLRAAAVVLVVYMHSMVLQVDHSKSWQQNFLYLYHFGAIGVDLFFVISGFIISFVANKYVGIDQGIHFLKKRFSRINPIYYLASLIFLIIVIINWWVTNIISTTFNVNNILSSSFDTLVLFPLSNSFRPLLFIGWTLSFEWLFYSVFFLVILIRIQQKILILCFLFIVLATVGVVIRSPDLRIAFITNPITLEFLLGAAIYRIYSKRRPNLHYIPLTLVTIGLISYTLLIVYGYGYIYSLKIFQLPGLGLKRFLLWGLPSSFIVAGCIFLENNNKLTRIWNIQMIQLIGDASYSIYLTHMSIFILMDLLYTKVGYFLPPDLGIYIQLAIAIIVGIGFHKKVEKPLLRFINHDNARITVKEGKNLLINDQSPRKI